MQTMAFSETRAQIDILRGRRLPVGRGDFEAAGEEYIFSENAFAHPAWKPYAEAIIFDLFFGV
jgi:hypothetical protein